MESDEICGKGCIEMGLILSIGGIPVQFDIRSKEMVSRITKRYKGFLRKRVTPVVTFQCSFAKRQAVDTDEVVVAQEDSTTWCIHRSDFICTFQEAYGTIEMRRSIYSFDACIRVLYATLITRNRGLLLHASGVVKNKKAYCFAGISGSGKTTIAQLSKTVGTVINDEIIAVRIMPGNNVSVYGTPFWGEMRTGPAYTKKSPLQALYFLKKDTTSYSAVLNQDVALAKLLRCCCIFSNDSRDMERIMNLGIAFVKAMPVYELHFEKSEAFWEVISIC
jgi:hypothetical protein